MAERAVVAGGNVCRVLAASDDAIMATKTGSEHRAVIDSCYRAPVGSAMTILAARGREYVAGIFRFSDRAVMAEDTIADDIDMVELPVEGCMTVVAGIAARNMPGILPPRNDAVVATCAAADYDRVVDPDHIGP